MKKVLLWVLAILYFMVMIPIGLVATVLVTPISLVMYCIQNKTVELMGYWHQMAENINYEYEAWFS